MQHTTEIKTIGATDVLYINVPNARTVFISIYVHSGYRYALADNPEHFHLPHILEHIVFEGSKAFPDGIDLQQELSKGGTYYNGHTSNYTNQYVVRTNPKNISRLLPVMFDMIYRPLMREKDFDEELQVVARELDESISDYGNVANYMNAVQSLPETGVDLLKQVELLEVTTLADTKKYHKKYYTAANTKIIISGDLSGTRQHNIEKQLGTLLSNVPEGKKYTLKEQTIAPVEVPALPLETPSEISTLNVSLAFISKGDLKPEEFQPLGIFSSLIASLDHKSIYFKLRKKGLLYSLNAETTTSIESHGLSIDFASDRESFARVLTELLVMLKQYANETLDQITLTRIAEGGSGSCLLSCETSTDYQDWYDGYFIHNEPLISPEQASHDILNTTSEQIKDRMSNLVVNEQLYVTFMGGEAASYVEIVDTIRKSVFEYDVTDVEEIMKKVEAIDIAHAKSRPFATWFARIGLSLVVVSSFLPTITDYDGKIYSMWSFGWDKDMFGINLTIIWLIIAALSMYVLRFGAIAKELFVIVGGYLIALVISVFVLSNPDANIPDLSGQIASFVMFILPLIILLLSSGDIRTWIMQKLPWRKKT